ncbi:MAG: amino acid adenylation domain-containing protein, partial [Alteromonadaceae bacterium]|nr:amino acid adenylation domain-containing protein [Alteromonadaceae bacterium]
MTNPFNDFVIEDAYPMSMLQQGMVFHSMQKPGLSVYHDVLLYRINLKWDHSLFSRTLDHLIARHALLRTMFHLDAARPLQLVLTAEEAKFDVFHIRGQDDAEIKTSLEEWTENEKRRGFDFSSFPWRICVHIISDNEFSIGISFHHALWDGWSNASLVNEMLTIYSCFTEKREIELAPLPPTYKHFIALEQKALSSSKNKSYWREKFKDAKLSWWSGDIEETSVRFSCEVTEKSSEKIVSLARKIGVQEKSVWGAIYLALLSIINGENDVVGSVVVHGRPEIKDSEKTLGLFLNSLPIRVNIDGMQWNKLLETVEHELAQLYEYRHFPLLEVQNQTGLNFSASLFNYTSFHVFSENGADEKIVGGSGFEETNYRLAFHISKDQKRQRHGVFINVDPSAFDLAFQQRIQVYVANIIEQMTANWTAEIDKSSILGSVERQQLLVDWNNTKSDYPEGQCLHKLFEIQVSENPNAIALIYQAQKITYEELNRRSNQLAHYLVSKGVNAEVPVGICTLRSPDMVIAMLAILKAGGCYVPFDPSYPEERLSYLIADSNVKLILTQSAVEESLGLSQIVQEQNGQKQNDQCCHLVLLDGDNFENGNSQEYLADNPTVSVNSSNLAYVIYTSGSTGKPKGVGIHHKGMVSLLNWSANQLSVDDRKGVLASTSMCFDLSVYELFLPLCYGTQCILVDNILSIGDLPYRDRISLINTVPSAAYALLNDGNLPDSLRVINLAGEPLKCHLVDDLYQKSNVKCVYDLYGPSETTTYSTFKLREYQGQETVGRPIANTEVFILDINGNLAAQGIKGELYLGGEGISRGYLEKPGLTAERFIPHPFCKKPGNRLYRTGDLVRYLSDGNIEYLGRLDHQIKVRGFRIELGEIENALLKHEAITDAVVVTQDEGQYDKRLIAYVVEHNNQENSANESGIVKQDVSALITELRTHMQLHLPNHMQPAVIVVLGTLPLTANGKVDRAKLPAPDLSLQQAGYIAPEGINEELLANLWSTVLKCNKVGRYDDFFELGGHSLLVTQLVTRIREVFSVTLSIQQIFECKTVITQSKAIEKAKLGGSIDLHPIEQVSREQPLKLSFAQQRLWFLSRYMGPNSVYNMSLALRILGNVDVDVLARCLKEIYCRHETLRTRFETYEDSAIQIIDPPLLELEVETVFAKDQFELIYQSERETQFDLSKDKLSRIRLIFDKSIQDENNYVLLVTMHHSVSDGWSLGIFYRELVTLYHAYKNDEPSPLAPLAIQYADYAHWQREWLQGEVLDKQLTYWRDQLKELPALLTLPTDRPRPIQQTFNGSIQTISIPQTLSTKFIELSKKQGVTLYMSLLAAFSVLMSRYSGQLDVAIGTPIANRTRQETEKLIGFFANTLVMRSDLKQDPSFLQLLKLTRKTALQGYAHQDIPFEQLVEELRPERSLGHSPLFQVMFILQNIPVEPMPLDGLEIAPLTNDANTVEGSVARFDLTLTLQETPQGIIGGIEYNTDLFDQATIVRMIGHYECLINAIVEAPETRVSRFEFINDSEKRQQLLDWNNTQKDYPNTLCIHELFEAQVAKQADSIALVHEGHEVSYGELNRRSNQLAHYLMGKGVDTESRVAICVERSIDMVVGILGILKAGGCYVPVDPSNSVERINYLVQDADVKYILTQLDLKSLFMSFNQPLFLLDEKDNRTMLSSYSNTNICKESIGLTSMNLSYVIYTSGSTGQPKGVMGLHRSIVNRVKWLNRTVGVKSADVLCQKTSMGFVDHVAEIFQALSTGAPLVVVATDLIQSPALLMEKLNSRQISQITLVPSLLNVLLESETLRDAPNLRVMYTSGEALNLADMDSFRRCFPRARLINIYGSTEIGADVSAYELNVSQDPTEKQSHSLIGKAIDNIEAYVLSPLEELNVVGVIGELYIGGVGLSRGYLNRSSLTAENFIPNRFSKKPGEHLYRTGDLVRYLPDGNLDFIGRVDHQVKIRGFRIELGEIESVLLQSAHVKEVVVLARKDVLDEQKLVAYVVVIDSWDSENNDYGHDSVAARRLHEELISYLQGKLPTYMIPSAIMIIESFPLSVSGKVDRNALPVPELKNFQADYVTPKGVTESLLAGIWCNVLKCEGVSRLDNFFSLGGHSLLVTKTISRIRDTFSVELDIRSMFENQTLHALALLIESHQKDEQFDIVPMTLVSREEPLLLSYAQQRMWFLGQYMGPSSVYNMPLAIRLRGKINSLALTQSLLALVSRHESLRTRFKASEDHGVEMIIEPPRLNFEIESVATEKEVKEIYHNESNYLFDLSKDLLCRIRILFDESDQSDGEKGSYVLIVTMHHSVSDGWSMEIFFNELISHYQALEKGEAATLSPLPIQYADYAHWQRQWLQGEVLEEQLSYWRNQLEGLPPLLNLPTDRPRPVKQTFHGSNISVKLSERLSARLDQLSQAHGVTLYMTLLSAFSVLMSRYSGQDNLAIGTPIANRTRQETEGLIGFFANTLVMRSDLTTDPRLVDFLKQTRETALQAYAHQDIPFERLVEEINPERSLSHSPLFQVMFSLQNMPVDSVSMSDLEIAPLSFENSDENEVVEGVSRFELTLNLQQSAQGIVGRMEYNTDLFDRSTIVRLLDHYEALLTAIVEAPETRVSQLKFICENEKQQLVDWNNTQVDYPYKQCIHQLFETQVANNPQAVALFFEEQQLNYDELNNRANQLAHHLIEQGVGPDVRVGLCVERSLDMVVSMLGILKAGGCYVPLDPQYPKKRLAFIIENSGIDLIVTQSAVQSSLELTQLLKQQSKDKSAMRAIRCLVLDTLLDETLKDETLKESNPVVPVHSLNLAYVIYTSGSTGEPKGVRISHQNAVNFLTSMQQKPGITSVDRLLAVTTLSFDIALLELTLPLTVGASVDIAGHGDVMNGDKLAARLEHNDITLLQATPVTWKLLLDSGWQGKTNLTALVGGEAFPAGLAKALPPKVNAVWNMYGPTETTVWSALHPLSSSKPAVSLGKAINNTEAYIFDGHQQLSSLGVPGELYLGGAGLSQGYFRQAGLTAERFVPHPFSREPGERLYRTGDLVRYLTNGELDYIGRMDHQVKLRGLRIELGEIESVLLQHVDVKGAVVQVREDEPDNQRLVAYVVGQSSQAQQDSTALTQALRTHMQAELPAYMVPSVTIMLAALPLTANGKVDRSALPVPDFVCLQMDYVAPEGMTEAMLANLWCEVLKCERVGRFDNFFELGGHSLLITQLISQVREGFSIELSLRDFFEQQTLQTQAQAIEQAVAVGQHGEGVEILPMEPVSRKAPLLLSFAQQRLWFINGFMGSNAVYNLPLALRLHGQLNTQAFVRSLKEIVHRHESLRTRFKTHDNSVFQVIDEAPITIEMESVASEAALNEICQFEFSYPFDLSQDNLCRIRLLHDESDKGSDSEQTGGSYVLLVTMHHSISDAWSIGIFFSELVSLYQAFENDEPSPLLPLAIQYADYAHWQREWLQGDILTRQLDYWSEQLKGLPGLLTLPTDKPRPVEQTFNGSFQAISLPGTLTTQLQALSRKHGSTIYMTLLAGFSVLMSRYSGQHDVAIGTPIANRARLETEGLIGFFVNTLVMRSDLSRDPSFETLLKLTRETALQGYAHQDIPFEQLVEELSPERSLAYSPLFQVMFSLQNVPMESASLSDIEMAPLTFGEAGNSSPTSVSRFDLTLNLHETPEGISGGMEYNTDLFEQSTIVRMLGHYERLLEAIVHSPETAVSQLEFLSDAERQLQLVAWNDTQTNYPRTNCVHELFEAQVKERPHAIALTYNNDQLSFGELNRRSNQLAHLLRAKGVGPEVAVGICVERSLDMVIGILGILKAGGCYVPLDPEYPTSRLEYMLSKCACKIVISEKYLQSSLSFLAGSAIVLLGEQEYKTNFNQFSPMNISTDDIGLSPSNLAYVIFTSGSTGQPKGVSINHENITSLIATNNAVEIAQDDVVGQLSNYAFDAITFELLGGLVNGGQVVIVEKETTLQPKKLGQLILERKLSIVFLTTALFNRVCYDHPSCFSSIKKLLFGGEAFSADAIKIALTSDPDHLYHVYGPTECTTFATAYQLTHHAFTKSLSAPIGSPLANNTHYVIAGDDLAHIGAVGELYIGGAGLSRGYLDQAGLTADKFVPNRFTHNPGERLYRTGDLVRYLPDGNLEFIGRADEQVKIRGFRIELGEIERALLLHEQIDSAIVMMRKDTQDDNCIVAYVVEKVDSQSENMQLNNPSQLMMDELRSFVQEKLPSHMVPSAFVLIDTLPLNANGKVDRKALPEPQLSLQQGCFIEPQGVTQELLANIWKDTLKCERVGRFDDFFELGGHSLLVTQLLSRILDVFGVEFSIRDLFEHQILQSQSIAIEEAQKGEGCIAVAIERVSRNQPILLSYAQQRLWFLGRFMGPSAVYNVPLALRLRGEVDTNALIRSLEEIVNRHEILRTRFEAIDDIVVQVIEPFSLTLDVELVASTSELKQIYQAERSYKFDLSCDQLCRIRLLLDESTDNHVLLVVMHHSISDALSMEIFFKELLELFQVFKSGKSSTLLPLPIQYADYAHWQRQSLQGEVLDKQLSYWRQQLKDLPQLLALPTDRPRPLEQTYKGSCESIELSHSLSQKLKTLSQEQGVTLYMCLLSAFSVLMSRYSGQDDVAVGTTISNRARQETEGLIGFFVNSLVMRSDLSKSPSFVDFLKQTREMCLQGYANQDIPFEQLVVELNPERSLSHSPLFQVMFTLQNVSLDTASLPALELEPLTFDEDENVVDESVSHFDLTLILKQTAQGIVGRMEYNTDLFDRSTIVRLLDHYQALLTAIVDAPETRVSQLEFISKTEKQQLADWNNSQVEYPHKQCIHQLFETQVANNPQSVAVFFEEQQLNYGELNNRANQLAHILIEQGVSPDVRVGLCVDRSMDMVVSVLGILKAGGCYVPLDPQYPKKRLAYIIEDSGIALIVTESA